MATLTNTELAAVNDILNSIGQLAVDTLSQTNPDVSLALQTLRSVSREVQSEGWSFNFEYNVELPVDSTSKTVEISDSYLFVDGTKDQYQYDLIVKNGKLVYQFQEASPHLEEKIDDGVWAGMNFISVN